MAYGFNNPSPKILHSDNMGATHLSSKSVFHGRTKPIELQYHWICQFVENASVMVRLTFDDFEANWEGCDNLCRSCGGRGGGAVKKHTLWNS